MQSPEQPPSPARTVLLMVAHLHQQGYERLRIGPGLAPSGVHWRCVIGANRAIGPAASTPAAGYSTGQGRAYFGWQDAADDTPEALAVRFCQRFPAIAAQSQGNDPAYVAWYAELLRQSAPDGLPVAYADYPLPGPGLTIMGPAQVQSVPLPPPPPGNAEA